jgi:hypothetical protein
VAAGDPLASRFKLTHSRYILYEWYELCSCYAVLLTLCSLGRALSLLVSVTFVLGTLTSSLHLWSVV